MTETALIPAKLWTASGFKSGQAVIIKDGRIEAACAESDLPKRVRRIELKAASLTPGFVDVQVNGGGGVLFNDAPNIGGIKAIGAAHRRFGTTAFMPTLISDDRAKMKMAIAAIDAAIAAGVPGVIGIHLEGPFLNPEKRGIHDADKFGVITAEDIELLSSLKNGKTLVTLAPEKTKPEVIAELTQRGIVVAAGHSMASYEQAMAALDAGLSGFTHLYNAMSPLQSRDPGMIAAALDDRRAFCGIIADGYHVHPAMLRLAYRAKAGRHIFLVTDAMPSVGAKQSRFMLGDVQIDVADGRCTGPDGTLAGSDLNMNDAVLNAREFLQLSLARAVALGSAVPAAFLGLTDTLGSIKAGARADFCELDSSGRVVATWIGGARQGAA